MKKYVLLAFFAFALFSAKAQTWSTVDSGLTNNMGIIYSMCVYNGELYVGGFFHSMSGVPANSLARWNGSAWDSVPGMTSFAVGLQIFDMVVFNNELVVVGNDYTVRAWNGSSWRNIGLMDQRQVAVDVYNNELYLVGWFSHADGIPTRSIARWDGASWDSVGGVGLFGYLAQSLKVYNGELYVAGGFYEVNGLPVEGIAKWNGISWDSVGVIEILNEFQSLCVYNNQLYLGGGMQINNSNTLHWIGRWNSTTWDSVGLGLNYTPAKMTVYNNELYTVGEFDSAGGQSALGIARWNDAQWNTVGSGLDLMLTNVDTIINWWDTTIYRHEHLYTLCVYNNELYVGGDFNMIGGVNANSIARWHIIGATVGESQPVNQVVVFPNPANETTTFQFPNLTGEATFNICDAMGREILNEQISGTHFIFEASNHPAGLYFYKLEQDGELLTAGKLIIE